MEINLL